MAGGRLQDTRHRRSVERRACDEPASRDDRAAKIEALQRSAGNAAVARALQAQRTDSPGVAFEEATAGSASALPHRERMEAAFGQRFDGVSAHVGTPQAQRGLARVGARAAAHGERVAFADPSPSVSDVAHELAHVAQQRASRSTVQALPSGLSASTDPAELAADQAAAAVVAGEPAPAVGTADGAMLHRTTVNTNGGVFDNAAGYTPVNAPTGAVNDLLGADIKMDFRAGELVEAPIDGIALIQTVKSVTDHAPGGAALHAGRDTTDTAVTTDPDDTQLVSAGGTAIDAPTQQAGRDHPNASPIYFGTGTGAAAPATNLNDMLGADWPRGAHVRNATTGALDPPIPAHIEDGPRRIIELAGQSFEMNFEVTALVTAGPMANTYLGSIEWGWQSDAAGVVTLKPFVALASGAPTATFMQAAGVWNAAEFHDDSAGPRWLQEWLGLVVPSVDLPITTLPSGVRAAVDMTTTDILARLPVVRGELGGLPAGPSVDRTNKEFELRALVSELEKRKINVTLTCNSISDTGGAASPPEDEIWLALDGGGTFATTLTAIRPFRTGNTHTYEFPVRDFLPLTAPVHLEVNEHDRAGTKSAAHDDILLALDWASPFATVVRSDAGGHYLVQIKFDK
jgi:hypothetical protein